MLYPYQTFHEVAGRVKQKCLVHYSAPQFSFLWFSLLLGLGVCGVFPSESLAQKSFDEGNLKSSRDLTPTFLSAGEAIGLTLEANPELALARLDSAAADNQLRGGVNPFLPDLSGSASVSGDLEGGDPNTSLGASLNLNIFNGLNDWTAWKRLRVQKKGNAAALRGVTEKTVADVLSLYFEIALHQSRLQALDELLKVSQERARLSIARMEVGAGSRLEQLQAVADLNADSSAWLSQQLVLVESKAELNRFMARDPLMNFRVVDSIPLHTDLPWQIWSDSLEKWNTALAQASLNLEAAQFALKEAKSGYWPSLSTGLSYANEPEVFNPDLLSDRDGFRYNVRLSVPIFDQLQTPRRVEAARISRDRVEVQLRKQVLDLRKDYALAGHRYESGLLRIRLEESNLEVANQQAAAASERFKVGASSALEFRDAQTRWLEARTRLDAARQTAKISELELLRLSGNLVLSPHQ
jgi:outer membrane protein TolC